MRTCKSCGRENPDDRDFCSCGEYLRWEPTGFVQAVTPEMARQAAIDAAQTPAQTPPGRGNGVEKKETAVRDAVPARASITLRLPDQDAVHGERMALAVEPGARERVLAMVRNQSGIVDNYELRVDGLPEGWWSIVPATVYLVPYGSPGTYEQEVEIHLHPPRTPESHARMWEVRVAAQSKANGSDAASAAMSVAILPYTETAMQIRPERAKGRRRADYKVEVTNRANAPVLVALEGTDPDGELRYGFDRPPAEIAPGASVQTTMRVRPPRQLWIGRAAEKRFEVATVTGEEAATRQVAAPPAGGRRRFAPQIAAPSLSVGAGGIQFRAPQMRAPQMPQQNLKLPGLKLGGGAAAPGEPLMPTQAAFRQLPWLPWWLVPVAAVLAAVALLLLMLSPSNVEVPDVTSSASAFEAEQKLAEVGLTVAAQREEQPSPDVAPGTVIDQSPKAGETAEEGSEVTLQVAIGSGEVEVPDIVGKTPAEADQILREVELSLGPASPQPVDPAGKISSQIPEAGATAKVGTPVDVFFPGAEDEAKEKKAAGGAAPAPGGDAGGDGAGGDAAAEAPPAQLAFDNNRDVLRVDATGKKLDPIADGEELEKDPAFDAEGTRVAYVAGDRILLRNLAREGGRARTLVSGDEYADLAWAPGEDVLAMGKVVGEDRDLCLGAIVDGRMTPECLTEPEIRIGGAIHWAPNGRSILAGGVSTSDSSVIGVVRWRSETPFSTDPDDWGEGRLVAEGVREAALSPDGKQLALIRFTGGMFQLALGEPGGFEDAESTGVRACKLAWRPDGKELAIVQADQGCLEQVGALVRLPVDEPKDTTQLRTKGDNPVFAPLPEG